MFYIWIKLNGPYEGIEIGVTDNPKHKEYREPDWQLEETADTLEEAWEQADVILESYR